MAAPDLAPLAVPELRFEAPPELAGMAERLASSDRSRLRRVVAITGLRDPGPPIRVTLAPEGTSAARSAPSWVVGYALGAAGTVVLLPARVPAYPDPSLESVLMHEVAHVLIARAARRRPIPRWFNEGVAMAASRFGLRDRTELVFATIRRGQLSLAELDRVFPSGAGAASRAYAFSGAVVRWLIDTSGEDVVARILDAVGAGMPFEQAFREATGRTLANAEASFWRRNTFWHQWIPFLGSSTFLWLSITMLFLLATRSRRARNAEIEARWAEEDAERERQAERLTEGQWVN